MIANCSRRSLLSFASSMIALNAINPRKALLGLNPPTTQTPSLPIADIFPTQPAELAREMVTVSHFNLKRVKELVEPRPSLAKAAWDWGFGDWETALGAASHMGNRPIAEYLLAHGARPSLFSAAMLGQLEVVKAFVAAQPGAQHIRGPHSITLLAHAKAGGEAARPVFDFLQSLGDPDSDPQAPLSDPDIARLTGTYVFGPAANQQIEVTATRGQLIWTRTGAMGRPLFHLGNHTFCPVGASSVRIQFSEDHAGVSMTIDDPDPVLTARRKQESK